jgi:indole-3-glycerol phosphate synthase
VILDTILDQKHREIARLQAQGVAAPPAPPPVRRDFLGALRRPGMSLIAEFKRRSPSKGEIRAGAIPADVARAYAEAGASAMSVLTDEWFFDGAMADLTAARAACSLPVLRKDFLIDPVQFAASAGPEGADCVLLIAAALSVAELRSLRELAKAYGQVALVEVHAEAELTRAIESGAEIIGINNRDLRTFEVSLGTALRLRPLVPAGLPVVAESGVHTREDVLRLQEAGVDAILVGEALMTAPDPRRKIEELLGLT